MADIYAAFMGTTFFPRVFPQDAHVGDFELLTRVIDPTLTLTATYRFLRHVRVVFIIAAHMSGPSEPPVVSGAFIDWRLSGTVALSRNRYAWLYEADVTEDPPEEWDFISVDMPVGGRLVGCDLWALANTPMNIISDNEGYPDSRYTVGPSDPAEAAPFRVRPRTFQGAGVGEVPFATRRGDIFGYLVAFTPDADNLSAAPQGTWNFEFTGFGNPDLPWSQWIGGGESGLQKEWDLFSAVTDVQPPWFASIDDDAFIEGMFIGLDSRPTGLGFDTFTAGGRGLATLRVGDQIEERRRIIEPTTYFHNDPWGVWPDSPHYDAPVEWGLFVWGTGETPHLRIKPRDDSNARVSGVGNTPTSKQRGLRASHRNTYV